MFFSNWNMYPHLLHIDQKRGYYQGICTDDFDFIWGLNQYGSNIAVAAGYIFQNKLKITYFTIDCSFTECSSLLFEEWDKFAMIHVLTSIEIYHCLCDDNMKQSLMKYNYYPSDIKSWDECTDICIVTTIKEFNMQL